MGTISGMKKHVVIRFLPKRTLNIVHFPPEAVKASSFPEIKSNISEPWSEQEDVLILHGDMGRISCLLPLSSGG